MPPNTTRGRYSERVREYLRDRLTLEIQIRARIAHGGGDVGVTEKLADRRELDAGLQHVDSGGMAQCMRMYATTMRRRFVVWQVLAKEITDPESCELLSASVAEYKSVVELSFVS